MALPKAARTEEELPVDYISREEMKEIFDQLAWRLMNMSGEEFLRRWLTMDFDEPDSSEVGQLSVFAPWMLEDNPV